MEIKHIIFNGETETIEDGWKYIYKTGDFSFQLKIKDNKIILDVEDEF